MTTRDEGDRMIYHVDPEPDVDHWLGQVTHMNGEARVFIRSSDSREDKEIVVHGIDRLALVRDALVKICNDLGIS